MEYTLQELAQLTESRLIGDPDYKISGYADLESAGEGDISFLSNPRYTHSHYKTAMKESRAGAVFVSPHLEDLERYKNRNLLLHTDPSKAFQNAIEMMRGGALKHSLFTGIHPAAVIHETCLLGDSVSIGPRAVLDGHCAIGAQTFIGAGVYVGPHTTIGEGCVIHPNVTIREGCRIGNRVIIQSGTVIGSCGFGFSTDDKGTHTRIKQLGHVVIEDDVEIGANCIIDRARFTETHIGQGTKIDSAVLIGHNVGIGKHTIICGQTAMAGSSKIGNYVVIAGQCGIDGHLAIADGTMIAARSGVTKSLSKGKYGGYPAQPLEQFNRQQVLLRQIEKFAAQINELKKTV